MTSGWRLDTSSAADHDAAALIWAAATAARDGDDEIASLDEARPVIDRVMRMPGATIIRAIGDSGDMVGFAAFAPLAEMPSTVELHYLGIRPDFWGKGVATALLEAFVGSLRKHGSTAAILGVFTDNDRAVGLYCRHGWHADGDPQTHPRSGRLRQYYRLAI